MKRLVAAAILALASATAHATSYSTDASDLWFVEAESGWGLNVSQQEATLFATLFVYDADGKPTWFVASDMKPVSSGSVTFSGDLFTTAGPAFSAAWNASLVTHRKVGTATFAFDTVATATFTYTVDGTTVTKHVTRQTWQNDVIGGIYAGVISVVAAGCSSNGLVQDVGQITITQTNGTQVSLVQSLQFSGSTCTYTGTYLQTGHLGTIAASSSVCGTLDAQEVQTTFTGITMKVVESTGGTCRLTGGIAGVRQ